MSNIRKSALKDTIGMPRIHVMRVRPSVSMIVGGSPWACRAGASATLWWPESVLQLGLRVADPRDSQTAGRAVVLESDAATGN